LQQREPATGRVTTSPATQMQRRDERSGQDVIQFAGRLHPPVPAMTRNRSHAEDLVQETTAKTCAGLH
jgi:DNA-directed RNA polymerase specialized sigma24 family protein